MFVSFGSRSCAPDEFGWTKIMTSGYLTLFHALSVSIHSAHVVLALLSVANNHCHFLMPISCIITGISFLFFSDHGQAQCDNRSVTKVLATIEAISKPK